jgi:hypothetical protein
MDKLTLESVQDTQNEFKPVELHNKLYVDVNEVVERQPIALSKGTYNYKGYTNPIPLVSLGNFMCIVGASKSMKSFLKSALISGCFDGESNRYFPDINNENLQGKFVADFDTEQGKYHAQKVFKRSAEMNGRTPDNYLPFALRSLAPKERLQFIEWFYFESQYKDNIGMVSIDGVADLVENVNDLEACNKVVNKLMKFTSETNSAMITVLHKNFGSSKPTGHLGSAVLKKAETVIMVEKMPKGLVVEAKAEYTRNMPFKDFAYALDDTTYLPYEVDNEF